MFWHQQDSHPPSVLCSPQPDVRGEPDKGEQQSPPEQPAGECWREKFHTWSLGSGFLGHSGDLFQGASEAGWCCQVLGTVLCPPAAPTGRAVCDSLRAPCRVPCAQDDTCLAELALALSLSLEISSKRRLGGVRLCIRTLQAELHEGLFCSPLLHHVTAGTQHSSAGGEPSTGQDKDRDKLWAGQGLVAPTVALEPKGFGCGITHSLLLQGVGVWANPSCDSPCPSPGLGEPSKSLSVLSRDTLKLIPKRVEMKLENTSMVLSMNSQKR